MLPVVPSMSSTSTTIASMRNPCIDPAVVTLTDVTGPDGLPLIAFVRTGPRLGELVVATCTDPGCDD